MRHERGTWNGICSDTFIETTFMRYGHAPGGIIGITFDMINSSGDTCQAVLTHKEEQRSLIESDTKGKEGIRNKVKSYTDLLDPKQHQSSK